jgi:hypothetical protein
MDSSGFLLFQRSNAIIRRYERWSLSWVIEECKSILEADVTLHSLGYVPFKE